jgi:uncharacterized protein (DUF488 family)
MFYLYKVTKTGSIWTIGHSVHTIERFIEMLQSFDIRILADVRSHPGSRIHPQFNQAALSNALSEANIQYAHLPELGGKRPATATNALFDSYTEYMQTDKFVTGIERLEAMATRQRVAYMCAEALWWQCHRSKISDHLFTKNWEVIHIMSRDRSMQHKGVKEKVMQWILF